MPKNRARPYLPRGIGLMTAILVVVFLCTFLILRFQQVKMAEYMQEETALTAVRAQSETAFAIHHLYSDMILPRAEAAGMKFTIQPEVDTKALPFPATFVKSVESNVGTSAFQIFSRSPWESNDADQTLGDFEYRALSTFENTSDKEYAEFSDTEDGMQLRYSTPMRMDAECLECHNSLEGSPRTDWKIGDLRGAHALTLNLPPAPTFFSLGGTRLPILGFMLLFLFLVTPCIALLLRIYRAREAAERERIAAERDRAVASSASKTSFLASMSHELRTPLNAIIGFSQLIEMGGDHMTKERYAEYAGDIQTSGNHLLRLVNDLLDLEKIESGKFEVKEERLSVLETLDECILLCDRFAAENQITVNIATHGLDPLLYGDRLLFKQIVVNLLTNAIKFSAAGNHVTIDLGLRNDNLVLRVTDYGVGIAPEAIPRIFDAYEQADSTIARSFGGTGLGLSITKEHVEAHNGTIEIASEPDLGTTVTVIFPAERVLQSYATSVA